MRETAAKREAVTSVDEEDASQAERRARLSYLRRRTCEHKLECWDNSPQQLASDTRAK